MVLPKTVTILITCHSHNFRQTIVLWACLSQHLSIGLTTFQVKRCNSFLARAKRQTVLFWYGTNCNDNLVGSAANVAWSLVIYPGEKHRRRAYHASKWRIPVRHQGPSGVCDRCGQEDAEWPRRGTNNHRAPNDQDTQKPRRALSDPEGAKQLIGHWQRPRECWMA